MWKRKSLWCGLLIATGLSTGSVRADDDGSAAAPAIRPAKERLIEYWLIGGSDSGNEVRRNVKVRQVGSGGWTDFVDERVRTAYQWGLRRFWLHNPFGTVPGEDMQFDQYLDAKEAGLTMLTDDFVSAWRPVVKGRFGEPVELVAYIGTANFDDDRLARARDRRDPASVISAALRCIQPLLLAGASIGADAASRLPDDGPEFGFYRFLEGSGVRVYIESRPRLDAPGWRHFPVASVDGWWHMSDPERRPNSQRVRNDEIQGEIVRILNDLRGASSDPADVQESISRIRAALLEGHTVVFRGDGLRKAGVTIDQLVEGIDEQLGVDPDAGSRLAAPTEPTSRVAPLDPADAAVRAGKSVPDAGAAGTGAGDLKPGVARPSDEFKPFVKIRKRRSE